MFQYICENILISMPREIVFNEVEVLAKVVDLFWKKGYNGTSMQDLSSVTGLNRSSIYNTYGSKKELYKTALKSYQNSVATIFQNLLLKSRDSREALTLIFDFLIATITNDSDSKGCFIVNCTSEVSQKDPTIKLWLEESQQRTVAFFEGLIANAQQDEMVNTQQTPNAYAQYLYSAFQGLRITGILNKDKTALKKIADNTLSILD